MTKSDVDDKKTTVPSCLEKTNIATEPLRNMNLSYLMDRSAEIITTYIGLALSCFKSACLSGDWNVFNIKENDWLIIPKPNNKMTIFGWTSATFANLSRRGDRFSRIPSLFDWTGRCSDHNAASWFALQQFFDVGKIFWNIQTAVKSAITWNEILTLHDWRWSCPHHNRCIWLEKKRPTRVGKIFWNFTRAELE